MAQRERTEIREEQRETLKSFFKEGMTRVGSPLISQAASATGLETSVVENWIGNYKRSFKLSSGPRPSKPKLYKRDLSGYNLFCRDVLRNNGTMKDIKDGWSTLGEDEKQKYCQEAAALRAHGKAEDLSLEMRELKIKQHLKQLKIEVSKLEALGVETAILSFDLQKSGFKVFELSSKGATDFLDSTHTAHSFALHFKAGSSTATPSTKDQVDVLVKKVQDLFNQKYKEAGGTGRLPYQSLVNQSMVIEATGLPSGLALKKPSFYGRNQLEAILKYAEQISFEIRPPWQMVTDPWGSPDPTLRITVLEDLDAEDTDNVGIQRQSMEEILEAMWRNDAQQMEDESSETATDVATAMSADEAEGSAAKGPAAKKPKQEKQRSRKDKAPQHTFSHPLLAASLKSHSANVTCLDFSSNGKYLASCADDRTVRIWSTKDFLEREHKCLRANVELDHATLVRFSPDSRAFITWLANGDTIRIFKMIKKEDGTLTFKAAPDDFPQKHKAPILNIGIAETGKFIMSASTDTSIHIWDLKGDVLASINTNQITNSYAAVSPCGRFVASCGFTPDVKVWEVCFGKGGEFKEVARAFDLKGHSAGVHAFAFSNDSHRMVTVSKDGTWKLWNTDVEYKKQQDPYLLKTVPCASSEGSRAALSPDGRVVAISDGCNVAMYNAATGELEEELHGVHSEEINDLRFDINGRFLACSGDKAIRVFHNAPGYRAAIRDMQDMLKKAQNEAMKQRLQQQIREAQSALDTVLAAPSD